MSNQPLSPSILNRDTGCAEKLARFIRLFTACVLCLITVVASAHADIEKRVIIGISNAQQLGYEVEQIEVRRVAEMPLNHLGLQMVQHDWVGSNVPSEALTQSARGALVWFGGNSMKDPNSFLDWANSFMESGNYIVLFGDLAFVQDELSQPADPIKLSKFFDLLGVQTSDVMLDTSEAILPRTINVEMMNFERDMPDILDSAMSLQVGADEGDVYFSIKDTNASFSDVVATTSGGGVALGRFGYTYFPSAEIGFWLVNPFSFFRTAFRMTDLPVPDTTTLNGRRIYFSHVDGDGWNSISSVASENGIRNISAKVMLDELIAPFPGMPVTVAAISGDIDPTLFGTPQSRDAAKEIFAMSQVELGTHTHTHPFEWRYFDPANYQSTTEAAAFSGPTKPQSFLEQTAHRVSVSFSENGGRETSYNHNLYEVPRAYYDGPFDIKKEIEGSIEIIEALAPSGKSVKIVQWSGDTAPYQGALSHSRELGLENMNGGQTRYDPAFPSVSYISPLTRSVGDEVQVLTPMVSEAFYTQYWSSRYFGFQDLKRTIDNTESPIRLRPINIYYHVYSADRASALNAVRENIAYSTTKKIAPITASHYTKIVRSALTADIEKLGDGVWEIRNRGSLNTLRFDTPRYRNIDYARSIGVLGHHWHQGSLYLALEPGADIARLALQNDPIEVAPKRAILKDSRWQVSDAKFEPESVTFDVQGYGAGSMTWTFPSQCIAIATYDVNENQTNRLPIPSNSTGDVILPLNPAPGQKSEVTLSCAPIGDHDAIN